MIGKLPGCGSVHQAIGIDEDQVRNELQCLFVYFLDAGHCIEQMPDGHIADESHDKWRLAFKKFI